MSTLSSVWSAFRAVLDLESRVKRMSEQLAQVDERERETRERVVYLEGVIAGAAARAGNNLQPKRLPRKSNYPE